MKKWWFVAGSAVASLLIAHAVPVRAAELQQLDIQLEVRADEASSTQAVRYRLSGTAAQPSGTAAVAIPVIGNDIEQLSLTVNGAQQEGKITAGEQSLGPFAVKHQLVTLEIPPGEWRAVIDYQAHGLQAESPLGTIAIPALDYPSKQFNETVEVYLPLSQGIPIPVGIEAQESAASNNTQMYRFKRDGKRRQAIVLDFATVYTQQLTWDFELTNSRWWWQTIQLVLPPDTNQQSVELTKVSPQPTSIRLDQDGNILLNYRLGPKQALPVQLAARTTVRSLRYNLDDSRLISEVPNSLKVYTSLDGAWADGAPLEGFDQQAAAVPQVRQAYQHIVAKAQTTSREDYIDLVNKMVADLRASGIPARLVEGLVTHNGSQQLQQPVQHLWAEAYLPGTGWLTLDPALGISYPQFGLADAYRIALTVHGLDSKQPYSAHFGLPQLSPAAGESTAETAADPPIPTPHISRQHYLLLPGIAVSRTTITMPAGKAVDGLAYRYQDNIQKLGSLAPFQQVQRWGISLAAASWSGAPVDAGLLNAESIEVLATANTEVVWWPLGLPIVLAAAGWGSWRYIHRRRNGPVALDNADEDDSTPAEELLGPIKKPIKDNPPTGTDS